MSHDKKWHDESDRAVNRRDMLKTVAGTATAGVLGTLGTGSAAAVETLPVAVNCGGNSYTASSGITYDADRNYTTSKTYTTGDSISGTTDDPLYQSERYDGGGYSYAFDVPNGTYDVTLKFAEVYHTNDGERVFDVAIEGTEEITNLDLHAQVGHDAAYDVTRTVDVTDGTLNIDFSQDSGDPGAPKTAAILVEEASTGGGQSPYGGTVWSIPGRIEAEDYDEGGEGVAYHDTDSGNNGGDYRSDDVDIDTSSADYAVGWIDADEWLEYTVDVASDGDYDLDLSVSREPSGSRQMHVEVDGTDVTGLIDIPSTGDWSTYTTVTVTGIGLTSGQHVVRLYFDDGGHNVHYMDWSESSGTTVDYDFAFLTDDCDLNLYQHHDQAVYSATADTTYHAYQATDTGGSSTSAEDSDGDGYILAYDHATGDVDGPVRIGYNPLYAGDTHGVPSMTVDGDGYIHVFFGDHSRHHFQYARSENPYDISSWIHPPDGGSGSDYLTQLPQGTYPCMTYNPDEDAVYVLYRSNDHNVGTLGRSDDGGVTWTDVNNGIMDFSGGPGSHNDAYVCDVSAWAGRIHMSWTIAEDHGGGHNDARRNVYHAAYNPATGNAETTSGKDLGTTITWSDATNDCMVKDTGDHNISGDSNGNSVKMFNHAYDANSDTAYIAASYAVDDTTSQIRAYSYQGVSTQSGTWQESPQLVTESPPNDETALHVNESGQPEIEGPNASGDPGLWVQQSDGSWEHETINLPGGIERIQRGVRNGRDEFAWYVRDIRSENGAGRRNVYAMGKGQPSGAGASYPKAPQNLRVTSEGSGTATVDWDDGLAGPSGVDYYNVYVDGSLHKQVTTLPPNQPTPRTWTDLSLSGGSHTIEVSLTNRDSTESAKSNSVTVNV